MRRLLLGLVAAAAVVIGGGLLYGMFAWSPPGAAASAYPGLRVLVPLRPGDNFQLTYVLLYNGKVVAMQSIKYRVKGFNGSFILTDKGPVPLAMIRPVTGALNPHIVYCSYFLRDCACLPLHPQRGYYLAAPSTGCRKYVVEVYTNNQSMVSMMKLVKPTAKGMIVEYMYLSYTSTGYTWVNYTPLCMGPVSDVLKYTAPGGYLVTPAGPIYTGKYGYPVLVISKKDTGIWRQVMHGKTVAGAKYVFVSSPICPGPFNATDVLCTKTGCRAWTHG